MESLGVYTPSLQAKDDVMRDFSSRFQSKVLQWLTTFAV